MNKNLRNFLRALYATVVIVLTLGCGELYAQANSNISGQVVLETDGSPVIGATIQLDGTTRGTVTDFNGAFTLSVPAEGRLKVSYLGYTDAMINLKKGQSNYKIKLQEKTEQIDEVVVVGYGTQKRKEVTGAVSRVDTEELAKIGTSDLGSALQGLIAGVNVQATSGEPGEASQIQIRGISSVSGSNAPLYVVDGVPYEGDPGLSASEIESIDVLKDAASAAVYGTRGAAGVILITTKAGKVGEMKISVDGYCGVQVISSTIPLLTGTEREYVLLLDNRINSDSTDDKDWSNLLSYPGSTLNDSNLMNTVLNNYALIQNYSINLSGGSKNLTYSLIANLFDQEGVIFNTSFTRYNVRSNASFKKGKLGVTTNIGLRVEEKYAPGTNMLLYAYRYSAQSTEISLDDITVGDDSDSETSMDSLSTTVATLRQTNTTNTEAITLNVGVTYDFSKALKFTSRYSAGFTNSKSVAFKPLFELYDSDGNLQEFTTTTTRSSLRYTQSRSTSMTWENMLTWNKKYGKHSITGTGVFGVEKYFTDSYYAQVQDLISSDIVSLNMGTEDMLVAQSSLRTTTLVGMMLRGQYSYAGKYMVSGSIRRDGSSRFAKDNRWGMFPSLSAGWNISDEPFFKPLKKTINALKFRASFGTTGNQSLGDYTYETVMDTFIDYAFGTDLDGVSATTGTKTEAYANEDIKWETTQQFNVGFDMGFLKNKITMSIDAYQSNKRDMLFSMTVPMSAGSGESVTVMRNVGDMRNRGIELAAGYKGKIMKKVNYGLNLTATMNQNTITKMPDNVECFYFSNGYPSSGGNSSDLVTVLKEGMAAGSFMVMPTAGVVNTEAKLMEYQKYEAGAQMGDLIFVDTNGDGSIDDEDRVDGGNGAPEFEMGFVGKFNYKGFDLSFNIYTSLGNEVINGTKIYTYQYMTNRDLLYQWSEANPTSNIPTYRGRTHDNYRSTSDIWVEDGSFIRLKNVMFGYSIPQAKLKKFGLTKLRLYVAADNLLTLTRYSGYDPEVGSNGLSRRGLDMGTYPISMKVRGGVQVQF